MAFDLATAKPVSGGGGFDLATAQPVQQAQPSLGQTLGDYLFGIKQGIYDIPQSAVEMGARGLDAVGLTQNAYGDTKNMFNTMNNIAATGRSNYTKGGRFVGNVLGTLPTLAVAPVAGGGALPALANGAIQGGLSSALTSNQSDSPFTATGLGAVAGGALGGIGNLAARGIASAIAPAQPAINQAADYVKALMTSAGKSPADLPAAQLASNGKPIIAAEAIGKPAEVALGALARRPGQTAGTLGAEMAARQAQAPQRIVGDFASASGIDPAAAQGQLDKFVETNQKAAAPLYQQAYAANQNIASPEIDRILSTPAGKKALSKAAEMMQNDGSLMGVSDPDLLEQAKEGGMDIPWKGGVSSGLKLRSLDYVKRALDDQIGAAYRSGAKTEGGILTGLKTRLTSALDDADVTAQAGPNSLKPEGGLYAQARAKAGSYLSAQEQFENGGNHILNQNVTPQEMAAHMADLGPADLQAYKGGIANRIFDLSQNGKLNAKLADAPSVQQKLGLVLGPDNASQLLQKLGVEKSMANFARLRVPGAGSPTAEYAAEMGNQDAMGNLASQNTLDFLGKVASQGLIKGPTSYLAGKAKDIGAAYLTSGMPVTVRDVAGRLLMLPPKDLHGALTALPQIPASRRAAVASAIRGNINHAPILGGLLAAPLVNNGLQP